MTHADMLAALDAALQRAAPALLGAGGESRGRLLGELARDGLAELPAPGSGATLDRWRALACVASHDLSLAKLYEGHTDALAILREAGVRDVSTRETWGMFAAEPPNARVIFTSTDRDACRLDGVKAWCSGGFHLDRALLTVWSEDGRGPFLASVSLRDAGVSVLDKRWCADGMAGADTVDLRFDDTPAQIIGAERFYLDRPGFWQGGAGIAACWHAAAAAVAQVLKDRLGASAELGWPMLLALGEIDRHLAASVTLLRDAAAWIDANPDASAELVATRARINTDHVARTVLDQVNDALGAGPLCRDERLARLASDLPVFIRQSHGNRDLASLGKLVGRQEQASWML